ncbi:hypothetical protein P3T27_005843 [Kitasatospora sp. MAA19]|nr:hypothetical protein [Kitasatospora sp. MAA19]
MGVKDDLGCRLLHELDYNSGQMGKKDINAP